MSENTTPAQPPAAPPAVAPISAPAPTQPTAVAPQQAGGSLRRILLINALGLLVLVLIGLGIFYIWHQGYYFYSTDDATVSGDVAAAAGLTPGSVVAVYHGLGSTIHAGDSVATLLTAAGREVAVLSPIDGTIISEGATPGEVVPAGQPLAQIVDLTKLHITAYVDENHIKDVTTGQGVDVTVDAVKDTLFHGTVTRILPAAASTFSALPTTDFASGNFTKVAQRVPVVITLDGYQGHTLYPGTSAEVTIHIHQ